MHDVTVSNIEELLTKIIGVGQDAGEFSLTIARDENGDYSSAFLFGRDPEDPDMPDMIGGSSYGYGSTLEDCLRQTYKEVVALTTSSQKPRVPERQTENKKYLLRTLVEIEAIKRTLTPVSLIRMSDAEIEQTYKKIIHLYDEVQRVEELVSDAEQQ